LNIVQIEQELSQEPEGSFLSLVNLNEHSLGACTVTGVSPVWEMHPDTEELFVVLKGEMEMILLENDGPQSYRAPAGSTFVVPQGIWHKPGAPSGATFLFMTPGQSLHSEAEDPRSA